MKNGEATPEEVRGRLHWWREEIDELIQENEGQPNLMGAVRNSSLNQRASLEALRRHLELMPTAADMARAQSRRLGELRWGARNGLFSLGSMVREDRSGRVC